MNGEPGFRDEFLRWWSEMIPSRALLGWTAGFLSTILLFGGIVALLVWLAS